MIEQLYFDTDCLSSFLWVRNENILVQLYGGKIIVPKQVYEELSNPRVPHLKQKTDILLENNHIEMGEIYVDSPEYTIYQELTGVAGRPKKIIGKGEASAIAMAKVKNGILASNNLKDVMCYVKEFDLKHIDTGHILIEAIDERIINFHEAEAIWLEMIKRRRTLPCGTFSEYANSITKTQKGV